MSPSFLRRLVILLLFLIPTGFLQADTNTAKVLIFSKTAGYRHDSIETGIAAIQSLGASNQFVADATEDGSAFSDSNLQQYKAVIFLSTTGDVLTSDEQAAFERFIRAGNGYVGVHAASDTEYEWPWYGELVGAYFNGHPSIQEATIKVADRVHPSSAPLPQKWIRSDEWYNFDHNPRGAVHVLATLDENTYWGGAMGFDHPTIWCHEFDGGRAWYTGGGHTQESYAEPLFLAHLLGGIEYAAGMKPGNGSATIASSFERVVLDSDLTEPMELAVAQDGRVFYIERGGRVKIYKPQTSSAVIAGEIPVFNTFEDGLLGIALDPGFLTNGWIYLMYSPQGTIPKQHVSRFTVVGDMLDFASEKILLVVPTQREQCCHSAGSLTFDTNGNLLISTGDNTNPHESSGFSPLDEQPGRSPWDAQKSASNANDLRGKILRIHPETNGTYSIPAGNLFPSTNLQTKAEIYIMGCRNPFRISVDAQTGWLYWGDVGPDANASNPERGPMGYDEWNQARSAGNYGWPYFIGPNLAYREFDFATGVSDPAYNPNAPVNNSPNNTGPQLLPPAKPAWIWYPYGLSQEFPELGDFNSRAAFAGPVYHFNTNLISSRKFPAYYDKTVFLYDTWREGAKFEVKLDDQGQVLKINPFLKNVGFGAMDMEFGPEGAMYLLEWGSAEYFLTRVQYVADGHAPVAVATASTNNGSLPLTVQFSSAGSSAFNTNSALTYAWSFTGNGIVDSTAAHPIHTYATAGSYNAQLKVTDDQGNQAVANLMIYAGNNKPVVVINEPPNGAFFDWANLIRYAVAVSDVEDGSSTNGSIPCAQFLIEPWLGHNQHAHSQGQFTGCSGVFTAPVLDPDEPGNHFIRFDASYTDQGAPGVSPLKSLVSYVLQPKHKQAEHFTASSGIALRDTSDPTGGFQDVFQIDDGDWISFTPMNLTNITAVTARAMGNTGGRIEIRIDATTGPLAGTIQISNSGGIYTNFSSSINNLGGTHELFFLFLGNPGETDLFTLNSFDFIGSGVNVPIVLQSAGIINQSFVDDPSAQIDFANKTIGIPITGNTRFYRIQSTWPMRMKSMRKVGSQAVIEYEF